MSGLESIPVRVEGAVAEPYRSDNLRPILLQVEQALHELLEKDAASVIDLGAMPFSAQDEQDLRAALGSGEVRATVEAFGPTIVEETAFPGVWLVEHQDAEQRRLTLHLEIARIPSILVAPQDDLADSLAAMCRKNRDFSDTPTEDVQ